jgi:uncharacterized protein
MKSIYFVLIIFLSCFFIFSFRFNETRTCVFDKEHDLTPGQTTTLDSLYRSHEKKTTNEIALVTTYDFGVDSSILVYAVHFLRNNGVGKKEKNNGVVIVFSAKNHQTFVTTGYGTEKVLKDEIAQKFIDSLMIPNFKKGQYFEGIWEGSKAIVNFLEKPENKIIGH